MQGVPLARFFARGRWERGTQLRRKENPMVPPPPSVSNPAIDALI